MSRGKEICSMLFGTVDKFRECSNNFNEYPPSEIAKITLGQLRVLRAVSGLAATDKQAGIMLKTLAAKINLTPGAASIIVDSLVKMKLLDRVQDENDRRAVKIRLSPQGTEIFERHFHYFITTMDELTAEIPGEELAVFEKVLSRIQAGIDHILESGTTVSAVPPQKNRKGK